MNRRIYVCLILLIGACALVVSASEDVIKRGRALQGARQFEAAFKLYREALIASPTEDIYVEAASLLGKLQKYENAEELLEKGLSSYPKSVSLMNLKGLILLRKGDSEGAGKALENVLLLEPDNSFAKKWLATIKKGSEMPMNETDPDTSNAVADEEFFVGSGEFKPSSTLAKDEQLALAIKLYQEMMELEKWEIDSFISLHRQVIEKCPLSNQAEESCWRLSNLYLLGQDPPDYNNVIMVLEHLLKQYPNTELMPDAKNRLLMVYQKTGQADRVVALYEELFTKDPDPADDKLFMARALEYADALALLGRTDESNAWYQKVIEKDNGRNEIEARAATSRLAGQ